MVWAACWQLSSTSSYYNMPILVLWHLFTTEVASQCYFHTPPTPIPTPPFIFQLSCSAGRKSPQSSRDALPVQSRACKGCVFHQPHPPSKIINCTTHSSSVGTCALAWRLSRMPPRCQPQTSLLLENPVVQRSRRAQPGRLRPPANYPDNFRERVAEPVALPKALRVPAL